MTRHNFATCDNPKKEILDFFEQCMSSKHIVCWDRTAHGIIFAVAAPGSRDAQGLEDPRFLRIKKREDLNEVFQNYEDIE